jgi:hypothetical protein
VVLTVLLVLQQHWIQYVFNHMATIDDLGTLNKLGWILIAVMRDA